MQYITMRKKQHIGLLRLREQIKCLNLVGIQMEKIHRNVIYSIDATLAGKGFKDPTIPTEDFVELFVRD